MRAEYPVASIVDHLKRWLNAYQYYDESLNDYAKRSKYNGDIVKNLIGDSIMHNYTKTTEAYINANADDKKEMLSESFENLSTYILLNGADSAKYGTLMKNFVSQYSPVSYTHLTLPTIYSV